MSSQVQLEHIIDKFHMIYNTGLNVVGKIFCDLNNLSGHVANTVNDVLVCSYSHFALFASELRAQFSRCIHLLYHIFIRVGYKGRNLYIHKSVLF